MQKNVLKKLFISHKYDVLLCLILVIIALLLMLVINNAKKNGSIVQVKQGRDVVGEYSLSEDGEYEFTTFYGSNTLVIENGSAYVTNASCKDHICENMGRISKTGETIICLPNEFFVKIINGDYNEYDAIVR